MGLHRVSLIMEKFGAIWNGEVQDFHGGNLRSNALMVWQVGLVAIRSD